jgi:hypothetical protein
LKHTVSLGAQKVNIALLGLPIFGGNLKKGCPSWHLRPVEAGRILHAAFL